MSNASQTYALSQEQRRILQQELETLYEQRGSLRRSLREQESQAAAATEDLFLELLEVGDALEDLLNYLADHPNPSPEFLQRLPRSLGAVHRKFLSILEKRQVLPVELEGTQPDFNLCRVVDREVRTDLPNQTITKTLRRGFHLGDKLLRPTEVVVSKAD